MEDAGQLMRYRKSPLEYYRTLGLQPGASKKEVRTAYLRLVKECHPDRFAQNPQAQVAAQEKLKALNEAYACLRDYRPDGVYEVWSYPEGSAAQWREYIRRANYEPPIVDPFEGDYQYRPVGGGTGKWTRIAWAFVALIVLNLLRMTVFPTTSGMEGPKLVAASGQRTGPAVNSPHPDAMQVVFLGEENRGDWISAKRMVPYFFVGSNKEDVYRVQGIPDWSNEQEWHYGDSRVYFAGNGVQRWKNGTKVPLKVIELGAAEGKLITVGAEPADVLSIQGAPDSVSESYWQADSGKVSKTAVWHYGVSSVEFSDGRVTGWKAPPGSALKVKN
jgi:hypothetical protein